MSNPTPDILQKRILETIPFGFLQVDLEGKIVYANNSAFNLLELDANELIGLLYSELPWDQMTEDREPLKAEDHTIYEALNGNTVAGITRVLKINNDIKWFSVSSSPFFDEKGNQIGAISNFVDITEKVETEFKIKESQHHYEKLIEEAPYAITIYNSDGLLITANNKCEDYWKIPVSEYIGTFNILDSELFQFAHAKELINNALNGGNGEITTSINLSHANNEERHFRIKYYSLFDSKGTVDKIVFFTEDVTPYVLIREGIKEEEKLKQEILDAIGDGILVVDYDGIILNINKSISKYAEREGIKGLKVGVSVLTLIDDINDAESLKEALDKIIKGESNFFEHQLQLKDGKWYNLKANPLIGRFGAVISFQNINTRKEIEIALEKSLKKYRNIYNKAPVMMHSVDKNGKIISVSDFWLDKMGYDRNEIIGKSPAYFLSKPSEKKLVEALEVLRKEGEVKNVEIDFIKKSGEVINVLLGSVAEFDEEGEFERSIAGMIDITAQKKIEKDLVDSTNKLLEAQRISKIGNYELDVHTGEFTSSRETNMIMGFGENEDNLSVSNQLIHPDDLNGFMEKLNDCVKTGENFFHIYRIHHLITKKLRWVSGRGRMIKNEKGEVQKMIGTIQDITEQRVAEDKIKRLSDRILLATEIANLGVWEYDRTTNQIFWEDQMYAIFSDCTEPITLDKIQDFLIDEEDGFLEEKLDLIKNGVSFIEEEVQVKVGDEHKYLRTFTRMIRRDNGSLKGMIGVIYDITEDKNLQNELESSLDEKNILVREVHHRVKNNMQLISSIMALKSYDLEDEKAKAIFEEINTRIKAMSVIHDRLYKFYNVSEIEIRDFLIHISKELHVLLGASEIRIETDITPTHLTIDQALLIGLIVGEMITNAIKHGFKDRKEGIIEIKFNKPDKEIHLLRVTNNGLKISEDVLDKNTGLGISLIKTFAKQLKGQLSLDVDNGFRIEF